MRKEGRHRRRKQAERKAFGLLLGMLLVLGGSLLFFSHSQGTELRERIGNVDFTLSESFQDELLKSSTIHLEKHSRPAYLRVRIFWGGLNGIQREEMEQELSIQEGWIKNPKDGYYYYQYPVNGGKSIGFFERSEVPERLEKIRFCMKIHVEAGEIGKITLQKNREDLIDGW